MKFKFNTDAEFASGIERLSHLLDYELGEGITVTAEQGERIGVSLRDGEAVIYYRDKVQFFRGIGILLEKAKKESAFEVLEDGYFEQLNTMIDTSRCAALTVPAFKKMIDYLAVMGYGGMLIYMEDMIELEGLPYFGYMRGRYTVAQLREIDDYAYEYGIEVIPCLECYGHMEKYLIWPEASPIKDTERILLAREPKTFEFLDKLISTASSAFRSKRIHVGMDEAHDMGRGVFLDKNGYVPAADIFNEFMTELIAITDKYGLKAMMWSDMYFRTSNPRHRYYSEDTVFSDETKAKIPEGVELVFWHYGEAPECDDYMLKQHRELNRKVIFAGGSWGWSGHFPEYNYMKIATRFSMNACRKGGVKEAMMTLWRDDNAECDIFANLYSLSFLAELGYRPDLTEEEFKTRFEACVGADADLFYQMSYYHNDFERTSEFKSFSHRFLGKSLFWQDIMEGIFDDHLMNKKMSDHYEEAAKIFKGKENDPKWGYLYDYAYCAMDYLSAKTFIAENLIPAYRSGNRELLYQIANEHLPRLKEKTVKVHQAHKTAWFKSNKMIGWQNLDVRYGGVAARCDTASMLINAYLDGDVQTLDELDEPRLPRYISGFLHYSAISTVNKKT